LHKPLDVDETELDDGMFSKEDFCFACFI